MGGLPWATDVSQTNSTTDSSSSTQSQSAAGESAFAEQLTGALQTALNQSGNGSQYQINVQSGESANQFTITVTDSGSTSPTTATATAPSPETPSTTVPASTSTASNSASSVLYSSPVAWTPPAFTPAQLATMSPADVYWAEQPPAVQQLRYMQMDQRGSYAEQLAAEGYTIDVPIMVDGGDPLAVMIQREEDGYTWVPSALQANIPAGPGMYVPGEPAYASNNPPAGSIDVTTAFAKGTDLTSDVVVTAQDAQTFVKNQSTTATTASA